jgi:hypothetical protein
VTHDIHDGDPRQVLHDSCGECRRRGKNIATAIGSLDPDAFARAWKRAADWQRHGAGSLDLSRAEMELLRALWAVQVQLEKRGIPVGTVPGGYATTSPGSQT